MRQAITSSPGRNRDKGMTVNIRAPFKAIQEENIKLMQKYKHKIDQEARKEIVFGHIANPKVSEIENTNEAYLNQKNQKKMTDYARLSMDETDRREF